MPKRTNNERRRQQPSTQPTGWMMVPLFTTSMLVYSLTLARTVTSEDSGELIAAAHCFGIPHPPGYPLWTILCGLFIRLVDIGSIALRANAFSAVCSALSTIPVFATMRIIGLRQSVAFATSMVWAFSQTLWLQSVITEVYGLNALLSALLLWLAVKWRYETRPMCLVWFGFAAGLGLSNHHTILFLLLPIVMWMLWQLLVHAKLVTIASILLCGNALLIGLLPYIYIPVRARANPPMNWGNPSTVQTFLDHLVRDQYGTTAPLAASEPRSWPRFFAQSSYLVGVLRDDITLPLLLMALVGLILMAWHRDPLTLLLIGCLLSCGVLFLFVSNIDLDRTFRFAMRVFFIPMSMVLAVAVAYTLNRIIDLLSFKWRLPRFTTVCLCLGIPMLPLISNYNRCDYSNYYYAADHARNILNSMLPGAIIFPSGDHNTFPLIYAHQVEGKRQDITIADKYGYVDDAVVMNVVRATGESVDLVGEEGKKQFIITRARRPVYFTTRVPSPVPNAELVPVGMLYHLLPHGQHLDTEGVWSNISYRNSIVDMPPDLGSAHIMFDYYYFQGLRALKNNRPSVAVSHFSKATKFSQGIKESFNNVGSALAEHGLKDKAISYFEDARQLSKHYKTPRWNLVRLLQAKQQWVEVTALLNELLLIAPDDTQVYNELGYLALRINRDNDQARHWWTQSLAIDPNQPAIRQVLNSTPP